MRIIEYGDCYEFAIRDSSQMIQKSLVDLDLDDGVVVVCGNTKSNYRNMDKIKVVSVVFDKKYFSIEEAYDYFYDYEIRCIPRKKLGMKLPPIIVASEFSADFYYCNLVVVAVIRGEKKYKSLGEQLAEMVDDEE